MNDYNSSEEWRAICEARHVCRLPSKDARQRYLEGIEKHRGISARERLESGILKQWESRSEWMAT